MLLAISNFIRFSEGIIDLMRQYLGIRTQYVKINQNVPSEQSITRGVLQSLVLVSILFNIFTLNLSTCLKYCSMCQHADDTQIYISFHTTDQQRAELIINQDITKLLNFSEDHGLSISPSKSCSMLFGHLINNDTQHFELKINNQSVRSTNIARNLGLMFENDLRFKTHESGCINSLKGLHPHGLYLSRFLKIMLCDTLVLTHFNFTDVVYGPCLSRDED
nr:unnamed protein product [Callosobruchus chinensis]